MFKTFLGFICHYRIQNPLKRIIMPFLNTYFINKIPRETKLVVSLSAEEENFDNLQYTLFSIFNQKVSPDKIVLWVSDEYELSDLPYSVTKFVKNGLDIRFVKDKGSYTKIIYALKEFGDCILITAEENICYPKNWLSKLYLSFISNTQDIHVNSAAYVTEQPIASISQWKLFACKEKADYKYFPIPAGGVLYPPNCFVKEIFRDDIYNKKVNTSWEVWSWVIALLSDRKIRLVKNHINIFSSSNIIYDYKRFEKLFNKNYISEQINQLFEYYGNNIIRKLGEK